MATRSPRGGLRVALVHDWLTGMRGGEKVLEVFADLFPHAPIYTLMHVPGSVSERIESHPIITSKLQRLPLARTRYRYYLPLLPWIAESLPIEPVDLVLSVSHCVAKGVRPPAGACHASYVLSPMRYLYDRYDDYFAPGRAGLATRLAMRSVRPSLQRWDFRSTDRVDSLAGISTFVNQRVRDIYGRSARLLFPPVDVDRFADASIPLSRAEDYYLIVSALVPYKSVDVAVEAFRGLDRKLVVAGTGPMRERLEAIAPPNVEFRGWVSDDEMPSLVAGCRAFLFPQVEDFGIAPIEAMAAGRPVLALGAGGALDTVRDLDRYDAGQLRPGPGPSGLFFRDATPDAVAAAVRRYEALEDRFDPADAIAWARTFDLPRFRSEVVAWLDEALGIEELRRAA